jgi:hypothetical protein
MNRHWIKGARWVCLGALGVSLLLLGCTSRSARQNPTEEGIRDAQKVFTKFMATHQGRGPKDEAEWKDFLSKLTSKDLQEMGIEDVNKALTSPRDNQPYVIVYGQSGSGAPSNVKPDGRAPSKPPAQYRRPIVMYEKVGSGGRRYVLYSQGGGFQEVTDAEFKEMMPDAQ